MENAQRNWRLASGLLFLLGLILALTVAFFSLWPDLEAALFDSSRSSAESLDTLRCPLAITPHEDATVSATFTNPVERPLQLLVQAHVTMGGVTLMRQEREVVRLEGGETREVEWAIAADDAAFERMILVRVHAFRSNPLPARGQSCGILVLNVPYVRGRTVVGAVIVASLLNMGAGGLLWFHAVRPLAGRTRGLTRAMGGLAALILVAMIASILGWWTAGLLLLIVAGLFVVTVVEHFFL